jgi:hypothetical protein
MTEHTETLQEAGLFRLFCYFRVFRHLSFAF